MTQKRNISGIIIITSLVFLFQTPVASQGILDPNARVEQITSGIQQPEGPVWNDSLGLLFSDIKGNKIYKWTQANGKEEYLNPSDSTNGLTYDLEGNLIAGQMGLRRIVRFEKDGSQTSLADKYDGKKLNSPNDIVVKSDGAIFFTDPDFNIPGGPQNKELSFNGIYRISLTGELQLLTTLTLPNGICFSPDERKLYVNDSQAHKIYVWDVIDDSTISNKILFYTIPTTGYADGMKIDQHGNIYCTCSSAVWVISSSGQLLGKIELPTGVSASNCTWGDADKKTLYITAGNSVYKVRPLLTAVEKDECGLMNEFKLFQNYPNPYNHSTKISYQVPFMNNVEITVFNSLGQQVATIVNEVKEIGYYQIEWNASNLSSGIYFYKMRAGDFVSINKMILLK